MRLGIIGCGLIGRKRALQAGNCTVTAVTDPVTDRATSLADTCGAQACPDATSLLERKDVDAVIVAATHDSLARLTLQALDAGKHVLVEKPGARHAAELEPVLAKARDTGLTVRVGFNHRFHPAFLKAMDIWRGGEAGPPMMIRGRYGHGGRIGYEKEWRADEAVSGGGEAVDQGVHLVDLARMFMGDFPDVSGYAPTLFWDMPVEDNAFMLLKTSEGKPAWLHATWSEWKNLFSFEVYGQTGKLHVDGLGGSYGTETLAWYRMLPEMGPPESQVWTFDQPDASWGMETEAFAAAVNGEDSPGATLEDAMAALAIVQAVRTNRS